MISEGNLTYTKYSIQISNFGVVIHAIVGVGSLSESIIDFEVAYDITYYTNSGDIKVKEIHKKYDKSLSKLVKGLRKCITKSIQNESYKEEKLLYDIKHCIEIFDSKIAKRFIDINKKESKIYDIPKILEDAIIDSFKIFDNDVFSRIYIKIISKLQTIDIDEIYSPLFYYNVKNCELKTFDEDPEFFFKLFEYEQITVNDLFKVYITSGKTRYNLIRIISKIVNTEIINTNIELPDVLPNSSLRIYIPYVIVMKLHEKLSIVKFKIDSNFIEAYNYFIGNYIDDADGPKVSCMSYLGEYVDDFYGIYNCKIARVFLNFEISKKFYEIKNNNEYGYIDENNPYYKIFEHVIENEYSEIVELTVARSLVYNCKVCDVISPIPLKPGEEIKFIDVIYGIDPAKAYLSYQMFLNLLIYENEKLLLYNNIIKKTAFFIKYDKSDVLSNVIYNPIVILKTGISYSDLAWYGPCEGYVYVDLITYIDFFDGIVIDTSNIKPGYYCFKIKNCDCCGGAFIFSFSYYDPPIIEPIVCQKCINNLVFDFKNIELDEEYYSYIDTLYYIIDDVVNSDVKLIKSVYSFMSDEYSDDVIEYDDTKYIRTLNDFFVDEKYKNIHPAIVFAVKTLNIIFNDGISIDNNLLSMFNGSTVWISNECGNYGINLTELKDLIDLTNIVISNGNSEKIMNIREFYELIVDNKFSEFQLIGNRLSNVSLRDILIYYLIFYTLMFIYRNDIIKVYGALGQYDFIVPEHIKNISNEFDLKTNITFYDSINNRLLEFIKYNNTIYEYEHLDDLFAVMNICNVTNYGPLTIYTHGVNPNVINYQFVNVILSKIYSENSYGVKSLIPPEFMFIRGISEDNSTFIQGINCIGDKDYLVYLPIIVSSLYGKYTVMMFSNGDEITYISPLQICYEHSDLIHNIKCIVYNTILTNIESTHIFGLDKYKMWISYNTFYKPVVFERLCDNISCIENFKITNIELSFYIRAMGYFIQINSDYNIYKSLCNSLINKIKENSFMTIHNEYLGEKLNDYLELIRKIRDCMVSK